MKTNWLRYSGIPALLAALLLLAPARSQTQLQFIIDNLSQPGVAGQTLSFFGTLTNTGVATVFLNGDLFTLDGDGLTLDDLPFLTGAPLSLEANEVYAGPLFDVIIDPTAPPQIASGVFTIVGSPDPDTFNDIASQSFGITIASPFAIWGIGEVAFA